MGNVHRIYFIACFTWHYSAGSVDNKKCRCGNHVVCRIFCNFFSFHINPIPKWSGTIKKIVSLKFNLLLYVSWVAIAGTISFCVLIAFCTLPFLIVYVSSIFSLNRFHLWKKANGIIFGSSAQWYRYFNQMWFKSKWKKNK